MNQDNPYSPPTDTSGNPAAMSPGLLQAVAIQLDSARKNPPTALRLLLKWPGTPTLLLIGLIGTALLAFLADTPGSGITSHWPVGFAATILGATLRDVRRAIGAAHLWQPQSQFIDWKKVDQLKA